MAMTEEERKERHRIANRKYRAKMSSDPAWKAKRASQLDAYRKRNIEKVRARRKAYRTRNVEKIDAYMSEYRAKNSERIKAQTSDYYLRNRDKLISVTRKYYAENTEVVRLKSKTAQREGRSNLSDVYIKQLLTQKGSPLKPEHIPQSLVDAKREHLRNLRFIK